MRDCWSDVWSPQVYSLHVTQSVASIGLENWSMSSVNTNLGSTEWKSRSMLMSNLTCSLKHCLIVYRMFCFVTSQLLFTPEGLYAVEWGLLVFTQGRQLHCEFWDAYCISWAFYPASCICLVTKAEPWVCADSLKLLQVCLNRFVVYMSTSWAGITNKAGKEPGFLPRWGYFLL